MTETVSVALAFVEMGDVMRTAGPSQPLLAGARREQGGNGERGERHELKCAHNPEFYRRAHDFKRRSRFA